MNSTLNRSKGFTTVELLIAILVVAVILLVARYVILLISATWFFFLLALIYAWLAFNLYRPLKSHAYRAALSFLSGWLTGELAFHVIAVHLVIITLIFIMFGVVDGLLGTLGLLLSVGSWIAMARHYLAGAKADQEMESALVDGLGSDYREGIPMAIREQFPEHVSTSTLVKPFPIDLPQVELLKDISYGTSGMKLDLYRNRKGRENCPVLLQIHGGAWTEKMGSKNEQAKPLMNQMAVHNWICVAIDYRLSPGATFPDHIIDCKEGVAWIKQHIAEYGGNPDFIVVTGGSAGGHLCALLALSENDPAFQPGFESEDTRVQGCVPFYGVYDLCDENHLHESIDLGRTLESSILKVSKSEAPDLWRSASPMHRIHSDAPPFLIVQGDSDSLVSVPEARFFAKQLGALSKQPVLYAEISGGQHAFDMFPSLRSEHVKHGVERFLFFLYSRYLAATD